MGGGYWYNIGVDLKHVSYSSILLYDYSKYMFGILIDTIDITESTNGTAEKCYIDTNSTWFLVCYFYLFSNIGHLPEPYG